MRRARFLIPLLIAVTLAFGTTAVAARTANAATIHSMRPDYTQTCPSGYSPSGGTVLTATYTFTYFTTHPVRATVTGWGWEYACTNATTNATIWAHYYYATASVNVSDSSLAGTGAVWLYNARTGSYLASTPTAPVGGSNGLSAKSGASNTVYSADGIKLRIGFRQAGASNYVQTGLYGPSYPL